MTTPARTVDFWFEFASTYSYPAAMAVAARAPEGVQIRWRPFLLGPILAEQGWTDSPFNVLPVKGRYMWRDLERICAAENLPLVRPATFPQNGLAAARLALVGLDEGWGAVFIRAVFLMEFSEQADISDPAILARAVSEAGGWPEAALERAASAEIKARLRAETDAARALGVFGAPTLAVGEEIFWGFDRMDQAFDWALRA